MKLKETIIKEINKEARGAGISRFQKHITEGLVCCITTFRASYDLSENRKRNERLEQDIRALGYGFIQIEGGYQEEGQDKPSIEESYAVIDHNIKNDMTDEEILEESNKFKAEMSYLCSKYEQDSILLRYMDDNYEFRVGYINSKGEMVFELSSDMSLSGIENAWSKIHNKKFVLKSANCDFENVLGFQGSRVVRAFLNNHIHNEIEKAGFYRYRKNIK